MARSLFPNHLRWCEMKGGSERSQSTGKREVVPLARLERALHCWKRILNPSRLPIPPLGPAREVAHYRQRAISVNRLIQTMFAADQKV